MPINIGAGPPIRKASDRIVFLSTGSLAQAFSQCHDSRFMLCSLFLVAFVVCSLVSYFTFTVFYAWSSYINTADSPRSLFFSFLPVPSLRLTSSLILFPSCSCFLFFLSDYYSCSTSLYQAIIRSCNQSSP